MTLHNLSTRLAAVAVAGLAVLLPPHKKHGSGQKSLSFSFHWFFVAAALSKQIHGGRGHGKKWKCSVLQDVSHFFRFLLGVFW